MMFIHPQKLRRESFFLLQGFSIGLFNPFQFFCMFVFFVNNILESVNFSCFLEVEVNQTLFIYNFIRE